MATDLSLLGEVFVISSLFLLGIGYFLSEKGRNFLGKHFPKKIGHQISILGWLCLGLFWWIEVEYYILIKDPVNALLCAAAVPFFGYLAYHEYLSILWKETYEPLRWLAAMTVVAGGIYFFVERVPLLAGWFIHLVAEQSVWFLHIFDLETSLGAIDYGEGSRYYRSGSEHEEVRVAVEADGWKDPLAPSVNIVLACTALQSMIIFVGGVICTKAPFRSRLNGFLVTVPPIYVLNLIRNAVVIWLTYEHVWGDDTFYWAHAVYAKIGSLIALVILAIAVFHFLPEMQDSILGVIDLPLRKVPENAPPIPFAKGMPITVVYILISGLVLFPFGMSADSIAAQGIVTDWPLEEMYFLSLILIFLSAFLLFFYRDPDRDIQKGIVSPADGLVQEASMHNGKVHISIFMNLQNVHVNRSPIKGRVISQKHKSGGYTPAFSKDSDKNERLITKLETKLGTVKMTQIAGFLIRRIVSYVEPNTKVEKGERIGLIHFGSRVDLVFEESGIELKIKEGDRILAGQTVAIFTPLSELSTVEKIVEAPKRILSKLKATADDEAKNVANIINNIQENVIDRSVKRKTK
jgi:phosphatidylserine decarboxylase|tara:strand:- start:754 stop:2484 length:1731 start_codon:yes stop_codon:yes gene_type:complete